MYVAVCHPTSPVCKGYVWGKTRSSRGALGIGANRGLESCRPPSRPGFSQRSRTSSRHLLGGRWFSAGLRAVRRGGAGRPGPGEARGPRAAAPRRDASGPSTAAPARRGNRRSHASSPAAAHGLRGTCQHLHSSTEVTVRLNSWMKSTRESNRQSQRGLFFEGTAEKSWSGRDLSPQLCDGYRRASA